MSGPGEFSRVESNYNSYQSLLSGISSWSSSDFLKLRVVSTCLQNIFSDGFSTYLKQSQRLCRHLSARYIGSLKVALHELDSGLAFYSLPRTRLSRLVKKNTCCFPVSYKDGASHRLAMKWLLRPNLLSRRLPFLPIKSHASNFFSSSAVETRSSKDTAFAGDGLYLKLSPITT